MILYNLVVEIAGLLLRVLGLLMKGNSKFALFVRGQRGLIQKIQSEMKGTEAGLTVWVHCASLGEYGIARPIIKRLKEDHGCRVVLTFFSSTGVEAMKNKKCDADHVFYLPLDRRGNVRRFLDAVKPYRAVFMVSEYWPNYLTELRRRRIPTTLVSAKINPTAVFFRWYGGLFRKLLWTYTWVLVLDEESEKLLKGIGYNRVMVSGDPLFDNAVAVAATQWGDSVVEGFAGGGVFVAGSLHEDEDMALITTLANRHRDTRFIIVPHEITATAVSMLKERLQGRVALYSECTASTDFAGVQTLIVDTVGMLAYIYRYARWAYVGGGFTRLLHSVIEATVYGVPVVFGPQIHRKVTPRQLIARGIGKSVANAEELDAWFAGMKDNAAELQRVKAVAAGYVNKNVGATDAIIKVIIYNDVIL